MCVDNQLYVQHLSEICSCTVQVASYPTCFKFKSYHWIHRNAFKFWFLDLDCDELCNVTNEKKEELRNKFLGLDYLLLNCCRSWCRKAIYLNALCTRMKWQMVMLSHKAISFIISLEFSFQIEFINSGIWVLGDIAMVV
jgi:hypothetical protein